MISDKFAGCLSNFHHSMQIGSTGLEKAIEDKLSELKGSTVKINSANSVGGGSINSAYHLDTDAGHYFLKVNSASRHPMMFEREAEGLNTLAGTSTLHVPKAIFTGRSGDEAFILTEFIEKGSPGQHFWQDYGRGLAELHRHSDEKFGFEHDNYIGSLVQVNEWADSWAEFFITRRLEVMVKMALDKGAMGRDMLASFDRLYSLLRDFFPEEKPALLHGDLWSGNYMMTEEGMPSIFDPAVYYGHREMDLGMSRLFGGFSPEFYRHYHEHYPLEKGWEERLDVANLYPLMVHVNLFGGSYLYDVKGVLKRVVGRV